MRPQAGRRADMARRYVLVGAGPASISAAETIRAIDPDAGIAVVTAEHAGYYSRPGLAYYLAKEIPEKGLFPMTPAEIAALGVELVVDRAVAVDPAAHAVRFESGRELAYDRLLLATGSWAIPLEVPGAAFDGVTKLDDMHDARDIIRRSRGARAAVVVGGGITALEIVEGLCARGVEVHYLMRKDRYWGNVLSEAESRIVEDGLAARGVRVHHFTELAQILGDGTKVQGIETLAGEVMRCDLVPVAIGVLPQKQLAESAGLTCSRGVLVDEHLRTSDADIFAAGDIAEVHDPSTGRGTLEVLWNSAVGKGRVAGHNMASETPTAYASGTPLNVTRLAGSKITIMGAVGGGSDTDLPGIARGDSETWRNPAGTRTAEGRYGGAHVRIALGENTIQGAVVMGDQELSFPLQEIIAAGADVTEIAERLLEPGADVPGLVEGFWRERGAHRAFG